MKISTIQPLQDNLLVQLEIHSDIHAERKSAGGIILPRTKSTKQDGATFARVVAVGPGHYQDRWINHEVGTQPSGQPGPLLPVNPDIKRGVTVILDSERNGQRVHDDSYSEYRMVREHNVAALAVSGSIVPLRDYVLVRREEEIDPDKLIVVPDEAQIKPSRGVVLAVGAGKPLTDGTARPVALRSGDVVLFGRFGGIEVETDGESKLLLREEDVLAVVAGRESAA